MSPKKKPIKKKSGKKTRISKGSTTILADGIPVSEMSKEQLESHVKRLMDELHKEREERNYSQNERDNILSFWKICQNHLEEAKGEIRIKDLEYEERENNHQNEIKGLLQEIRDCKYEKELQMAEIKAENLLALEISQNENESMRNERDNESITKTNVSYFREKEFQEILRLTRLRNIEEMEELQEMTEERIIDIENTQRNTVLELTKNTQLSLLRLLSEAEERYNNRIESFKHKSQEDFTEMKNYYNDITTNNLGVIGGLKEKMSHLTQTLNQREKTFIRLSKENKILRDSLKKEEEKASELQRLFGTLEKHQKELSCLKKKYERSCKEAEGLQWKLDILEQKYNSVSKERDDLVAEFNDSILEIQKTSSLKSLILEKKITCLQEKLERKTESNNSSTNKDKRQKEKKQVS